MKRTLEERFWEKVDKKGPDDCWEWMGAKIPRGYGEFSVSGKNKYAHRISWRLTNGPIPKGMCVLHRCDNPSCVNPAHLFLGTNTENMRDRDRKGRQARGKDHGMAKLTPQDVGEIRKMLAQGVVQRVIAEKYGIARSEISHIKTGAKWRSLK